MAEQRLQKILAAAGIASRRRAEELIAEGRVQVNGKVVMEPGTKADPERDHVRVDNKLLQGAQKQRYYVLHKPRGYVTTVSDPEGRPTVMEFFSKVRERLYPVGRLDYHSEGLLIMTNDGDMANRLTRASSGVQKVYLVKVAGQPTEEALEQLREGVMIERGRPGEGEGRVRTAPASIRRVRPGDNPWYEVTLIEGRNREIRKMFEEIGHHAEKIKRVAFGPLDLDVPAGEMRELELEEVEALRRAVSGPSRPRPALLAGPRAESKAVSKARPRPSQARPFQGRPSQPGAKSGAKFGAQDGSKQSGSSQYEPNKSRAGQSGAGRSGSGQPRSSSARPSQGAPARGSNRTEGRPSARPDTRSPRPEGRSSARPETRSSTRPDSRPEARSSARSAARRAEGSGASRPGSRSEAGARPDARAGAGRPSKRFTASPVRDRKTSIKKSPRS